MNYQTMFLTFFNDFLTVAYFAEYYCLTEHEARVVINKGHAIHEAQFGSIT